MAAMTLSQSAPFSFDVYKCVRTDYFHAACRSCFDICPEGAFSLANNKLKLDEKACTACGACIGGCPSEALAMEAFDENNFVLRFAKGKEEVISCKSNAPCLAVFDTDHYTVIALRREEGFKCDLSHCDGCELNKEKPLKQAIGERIVMANRFLETIGSPRRIETILEASGEPGPDKSRRGFFRKFTQAAVTTTVMPKMQGKALNPTNTPVPIKQTLLKNTLKDLIEPMGLETVTGSFNIFHGKKVETEKCTACGDCASFCPTDAISTTSDRETLLFQSGKCIGCGICVQVCPEKCVVEEETTNLLDYAFDRMSTLVAHDMRVCKECDCAFSYKGGEQVCPRCREYNAEFGDMFTPAYMLDENQKNG